MFSLSDRVCHEMLRMKIGVFQQLCGRLRGYGLADSRFMRVEEQVALYRDVVINAIAQNFSYDKGDEGWYHYFQDVVGAIDGTHIAANVHVHEHLKYQNRKQIISQNILVACTFDMKFTYVLAAERALRMMVVC
ncbi:uncharacterized protein M6B38_320905 [Iris pallida]|uniref:DUF8040 domain-containing protein n=1 Tax=Iris pallida TaxID=29817 RepID=A0AAX6HCH7_IRIPA|nr:uncharacterized protein M6B38_320905 [Iris pallida]